MKTIRTAILLFLGLTVLTGIVYPLFITGVAQLVFPAKANGSLLVENRQVIGSALLGQRFDSTAYFSSRPSATDYQTLPSSGSNLAVTSNKLLHQVAVRAKQFGSANGLSDSKAIPSEMLFASASGLDPHISPQAARLQVNRIVNFRRLNADQKKKLLRLIDEQTEKPQFFCLGESRVNVLQLNLLIDNTFK